MLSHGDDNADESCLETALPGRHGRDTIQMMSQPGDDAAESCLETALQG
jgi:hypothetical protein